MSIQTLEVLSSIGDLISLVKDLSDFTPSDSPLHLGIVIVGLVKPKKEDI